MTKLSPLANSLPSRYKTSLILCPFGGASYGSFRSWSAMTRPSFKTSLYIYPGHGQRTLEPYARDVESLGFEVACTLRGVAEEARPWILSGHSLGALVAFEACRVLARWCLAPDGIVLSGCHAPHLQAGHPLSHLSDADFVDELVRTGGAPQELRDNQEFRQMFLPLLRSDFRIAEAYSRRDASFESRLTTPCLLLWGDRDIEASREDVEGWREWFTGEITAERMSGDHFYPVRHPETFCAAIVRAFRDRLIEA